MTDGTGQQHSASVIINNNYHATLVQLCEDAFLNLLEVDGEYLQVQHSIPCDVEIFGPAHR